MAPNIQSTSSSECLPGSAASVENKAERDDIRSHAEDTSSKKYNMQIIWKNVLIFTYLHLAALYGFYLTLSCNLRIYTFIWGYVIGCIGAFGTTAGAHRLWSHRSYKAKWPLRVILAVFQTIAFQGTLYEWCRDHRVHHKFSETDADPHNAARGFFFSHIGWLMCRKHPDVIRKGAGVDLSDLEQDPIVMWQKKYYTLLVYTVNIFIPIFVPCYFWDELFWTSWYTSGVFRYVLCLHITWLVNSAAHIWGDKPYDKDINPTENKFVSIVAFGEGWHNYHHLFPWDYKAAELGNYSFNCTTAFIDFFAKIGWAYDLKSVPVELIRKRAIRTGDGNRKCSDAAARTHYTTHA